jgi:hypothetical protein
MKGIEVSYLVQFVIVQKVRAVAMNEGASRSNELESVHRRVL